MPHDPFAPNTVRAACRVSTTAAVSLAALAASLTACGTERSEAGDDASQSITSTSQLADGDLPKTTPDPNGEDDAKTGMSDDQDDNDGQHSDADNTGSAQWSQIETDPEVGGYELVDPIDVLVDPDDEQRVLVRFAMGYTPCSGAKAEVDETAETVTVRLFVGLHNNVAAMTCPAGQQNYELAVPLTAPVMRRTLQF